MIVFRVDANEQVATGHLMRTLSIASACRKCGLMCEFWLAEEKETERIAISLNFLSRWFTPDFPIGFSGRAGMRWRMSFRS